MAVNFFSNSLGQNFGTVKADVGEQNTELVTPVPAGQIYISDHGPDQGWYGVEKTCGIQSTRYWMDRGPAGRKLRSNRCHRATAAE